MNRDSMSQSFETESGRPMCRQDRPVELSRRTFVQALGGGLLISVTGEECLGQRGGRGRSAEPLAARLHLDPDGTVTVMTGKVEEGQGSRAQLTQAAAEELRVHPAKIRLVMADTALVPDDGITAGSRTTPSTVPAVRQGAAAARELLTSLAARRWEVDGEDLELRDGVITHTPTGRTASYADLAKSPEVADAFRERVSSDVDLVSISDWRVIGTSLARPNIRDLVTGQHRYPSDVVRPGMLYGKILRPPSYGATLETIDLSPAEAIKDVVVVREGEFIGLAAPTTFLAQQALEAVAKTADWKTVTQPSSEQLYEHLKRHAQRGRPQTRGDVDQALAGAFKSLSASYEVAYVQHAPMEPRAATADWQDGRLTVWTGVDGPHRVQADLARDLKVAVDRVRVIVPDMGGGFGGKHSGEAALEAARLAKAAGCPVAVHWTRAEEFTWAYFRPAAVIQCRAGLDRQGSLVAWDVTNINAGGSAIDPPYAIPHMRTVSVRSDSPLRQGSYRCLGATANNFARESFVDELASAAQTDPLEFRLAHLQDARLRAVLDAAAKKFDWNSRRMRVSPELGVGLACGTEKGSVVAACVEVAIDRAQGTVRVNEVCEAFECGAIHNPANLVSQVQGCVMMGIGPALFEAVRFADGKIQTDSFAEYRVPRLKDMPKIDVQLVENRDLPSTGAGETPLIAVAPAIANAIFAATGSRLRSMPLKFPVELPG